MPSSLATVLSLTLGSSPCPPVSVLVRAAWTLSLEAFLGSWPHVLRYLLARSLTFRVLHLAYAFHCKPAAPLRPKSIHRVTLAFSVTPSLALRVQEYLPVFPSTTPFGLALGPDLPRADEPSPGILGLSVCRILTCISLLTPAFSLPCSPPFLPVRLPRACNAPLPFLRIRSFGIMLSPGTFSAQGHSTSELLRTL